MLEAIKMYNSSLTLAQAIFGTNLLNDLGCCKLLINDIILWDDDVPVDSYVRLEDAWNAYCTIHWDWDAYRVVNIYISIVDQHHSIINLQCTKG